MSRCLVHQIFYSIPVPAQLLCKDRLLRNRHYMQRQDKHTTPLFPFPLSTVTAVKKFKPFMIDLSPSKASRRIPVVLCIVKHPHISGADMRVSTILEVLFHALIKIMGNQAIMSLHKMKWVSLASLRHIHSTHHHDLFNDQTYAILTCSYISHAPCDI
jgi:hypothetical protein